MKEQPTLNMGYMFTSGKLRQEEDGYAGKKNSNRTIVDHPNVIRLRVWKKQFNTAGRTIEQVGKSTNGFEAKLLESLKNMGYEPGSLGKTAKKVRERAIKDTLDASMEKVGKMLARIKTANEYVWRAKREAVLPCDKLDVAIAKRELDGLEGNLKELLGRIATLRESRGPDSTL